MQILPETEERFAGLNTRSCGYFHGICYASMIDAEWKVPNRFYLSPLFSLLISCHFSYISRSSTAPSLLCRRRRIFIQYPLLQQLLGLRSLLQLLLQTVRSHVFLQFLLLALYGRGGRGVGKDVSFKPPKSQSCGILLIDSELVNENFAESYVQSTLPSPGASPVPSSSCRSLVGAQVLVGRIVSRWSFVSSLDPNMWVRGEFAYGAAFVSRRMFLFLRS